MNNHGKVQRAAYKRVIDKEAIEAALEYFPKTGKFFWRTGNAYHEAGDIAGYRHPVSGYVYICCLGFKFAAHQLAHLVMTGEWPANDIDHVNGVRWDNSWSNLRAATRSENLINRVGFGKSGYKNIVEQPQQNGRMHYRVAIRRGELFFQSRVLKTLEEALAVRDEWLRCYGCKFTSTRHINDND